MNPDVIHALKIMGSGMLAIFIVIIILTLIVLFLTWVTNLKVFKKN